MRILFLAPLPPPLNGQSLASQVLHDELARHHEVRTVDFGQASEHSGGITIGRLKAVARILVQVAGEIRAADAVYLTISESVAGNLKDLLIYAICRRRARRTWLHLHGGSIGEWVFGKYPLLRRLNARFIQRMAGVIVSGPSHVSIFSPMIAPNRIHALPNFALGELFVDPADVEAKFKPEARVPLRILYVSGMIPKKGFALLADAVRGLTEDERRRLRVDFAGKFRDAGEEAVFRSSIREVDQLRYHGLIDAETKRRLFAEAHIFCLPTQYSEGQPISILEAYASGCAVMATTPPGILDIFEPGANGYAIQTGSTTSIRDALRRVLAEPDRLAEIARHNRAQAGASYTVESYAGAVRALLEQDATEQVA